MQTLEKVVKHASFTIKTPEQREWYYFTPCYIVFIANFEQVNAGC